MKKKVLVLGGTMFVGRALVEKLITMPQYDITLFNRGKSNSGLFNGVKQLHGNRETDDILQICNESWDCIIDFSGYYPTTFEKLLNDLKGKVKRYIFISTISVYELDKFENATITESDPIHACTEEQKNSKLPDAYGEKKAEMERILLKEDGLDKIILRPSFIYGKYDWTERFYYWLYRAKFFDKMLMPGDFNVALTYAGDLVSAILNAIETTQHKTVYNTVSQNKTNLRQVVQVASGLLHKNPQLVEPAEDLLQDQGLHASPFPLFVPFNFLIEGNAWLSDFAVQPTSFEKSIEETIHYHDSLGWQVPKAGLSVEREKQILGI